MCNPMASCIWTLLQSQAAGISTVLHDQVHLLAHSQVRQTAEGAQVREWPYNQ